MAIQEISLRELLESGAHFGHQSRRWNPKMNPYIYQTRDNVHVIDLSQTAQGLKEACQYVHDLVAEGGNVLFIGTKRQAKDLIKAAAQDAGMPFIVERWVGGMLTNWDTILKNIQRLTSYQKSKETGDLLKYTKKEQSLMSKETDRLNKIYEGLLSIDKLPDAVFVVDVRKEKIAIKEAHKRGIPIIAMCDTNSDPTLVDIVIPANDDALKAIEYIVKSLSDAIKAGKDASDKGSKDSSISAESTEAPKKRAARKPKTEQAE